LDNFHWVSAGLALANAQGLTIDVIYVGVDGGWMGPDNVDTILFSDIQVNNVIRFPA